MSDFTVQVLGEGADKVINLTDVAAGTSVEVYAFGALLNKFSFKHPLGVTNVIDGFNTVGEAQTNLTPLFKSAKLSPFVCRVNKGDFTFGEKRYHLDKYVTNGNAIHGLIYDAVFEVTDSSADSKHASVTLSYNYENEHEGFPFHYKAEVVYTLSGNNTLLVATNITNTSEGLIPITDGWHPYFTLGSSVNDCQLEFQSKEILVFDENLIPTGALTRYEEFGSLKFLGDTQFDNCFTVNFAECPPACVLRDPKQKIQIEIHPDKSYPYLQIFTPSHRKSIAIENLSAAPDAFNNGMGLRILEAGGSASFQTKFVLKSL